MTKSSWLHGRAVPRRRAGKSGALARTLLAGALLSALGGVVAPPSYAASAGQMNALGMGYGDLIWNYDFTTTTNASWKTVDWATSILFYDNANIQAVKNIASTRGYGYYGGTKYEFMVDAYGSGAQGGVWDGDGGVKTGPPLCINSTRHARVYAPPNTDTMYNPGYGFFVFATTHYDHHEACNSYFDDSEGTEQDLASKFAAAGKNVYRDYSYFYNAEHRNEGNHHWNNNGYATYIRL